MRKRLLCEIEGDATEGEAGEIEITVKVKGLKALLQKPDATDEPATVEDTKSTRKLLLG